MDAQGYDELIADAVRYRWLRDNNDKRFVLWDRCSHEPSLSPRPVLDLDKVIDEQIAAPNVELTGTRRRVRVERLVRCDFKG